MADRETSSPESGVFDASEATEETVNTEKKVTAPNLDNSLESGIFEASEATEEMVNTGKKANLDKEKSGKVS